MSNVFKEQVVLYETRDHMERISPGAVDTNAFSNMVARLQKEYNDARLSAALTSVARIAAEHSNE